MYDYFYSINGIFLIRLPLKTFDGNYGMLNKRNIVFRMSDLDCSLMQEIKEFIYWLVDAEELIIAKALRQILVDKQKQLHFQQVSRFFIVGYICDTNI